MSSAHFGTPRRYTVPLRQGAGLSASQVGSKAANLAKLLAAGFPGPDGFVVITDAFQQFLAANAFGPSTVQEAASSRTARWAMSECGLMRSTASPQRPLRDRSGSCHTLSVWRVH